MSVTYHRDDAADARTHLDRLADLYAVVFAEPPYNEGPEHLARFRTWMADELVRPGFALVRAEVGQTLAGMAFGHAMPTGGWWGNAATEPPEAVRGVEKFAVIEWAVHPDHRRHGIGRELMRRLLAGRSERYATLNVFPNAPARAIYLRDGWTVVGRSTATKLFPAMDILGLPLSPDSSVR